MNEGSVIEALSLTKVYGGKAAVDGIDFQVKPAMVTGFLGPNGAGKSTTMRMILGLDRPTSGTVTVGGRGSQGTVWPLHEVGALLDARAVHPGRSAQDHLHSLAAANGIARTRVGEVLEEVGLTSVARKKAGTFSLGMLQRLGIAGALLGDPGTLLFDEPVNGLDPEGIIWIRTFGLLVIPPIVFTQIRDKVTRNLAEYMPDAGERAFHLLPGGAYTLRPWPGLGVEAAYVAVAAAAAFALILRRDIPLPEQEARLAETTVKSHVQSMLGKLGVRDRLQAAVAAYDAGLVRPRGS